MAGSAMRLVLALLALLTLAGSSLAAEWQRYVDPQFGYAIELPADGFDVETEPGRNGLTLLERDGRAQIDVYATANSERLSLAGLREIVAGAERIKEITYSRSGNSWFVLSGYYRRLGDEATDLIFYAKFMLSADGRSFSAFEASYPLGDKQRFDPVIERIEDSLTRPRG